MPTHPRDENGLTPQQAKVATEIATAGSVTPEVMEQVAARLVYGSTRPVNALVQRIREQLGCTRADLPAELRRLGYSAPGAGGESQGVLAPPGGKHGSTSYFPAGKESNSSVNSS